MRSRLSAASSQADDGGGSETGARGGAAEIFTKMDQFRGKSESGNDVEVLEKMRRRMRMVTGAADEGQACSEEFSAAFAVKAAGVDSGEHLDPQNPRRRRRRQPSNRAPRISKVARRAEPSTIIINPFIDFLRLDTDKVVVFAMESIRPAFAALRLAAPRRAPRPLYQCLHTSTSRRATPLPHPSVPGPPPETPTPAASDPLERVARKRKQAELLAQAKEVRSAPSKPKSVLQKRFWKDVTVKETDGTSYSLRTVGTFC